MGQLSICSQVLLLPLGVFPAGMGHTKSFPKQFKSSKGAHHRGCGKCNTGLGLCETVQDLTSDWEVVVIGSNSIAAATKSVLGFNCGMEITSEVFGVGQRSTSQTHKLKYASFVEVV